MSSKRSEKLICAPPRLSELSPSKLMVNEYGMILYLSNYNSLYLPYCSSLPVSLQRFTCLITAVCLSREAVYLHHYRNLPVSHSILPVSLQQSILVSLQQSIPVSLQQSTCLITAVYTCLIIAGYLSHYSSLSHEAVYLSHTAVYTCLIIAVYLSHYSGLPVLLQQSVSLVKQSTCIITGIYLSHTAFYLSHYSSLYLSYYNSIYLSQYISLPVSLQQSKQSIPVSLQQSTCLIRAGYTCLITAVYLCHYNSLPVSL